MLLHYFKIRSKSIKTFLFLLFHHDTVEYGIVKIAWILSNLIFSCKIKFSMEGKNGSCSSFT